MGSSRGQTVVAIAVCLLWLSGCESSTRLGDPFQAKPDAPQAEGGAQPPSETPEAKPDAPQNQADAEAPGS